MIAIILVHHNFIYSFLPDIDWAVMVTINSAEPKSTNHITRHKKCKLNKKVKDVYINEFKWPHYEFNIV